MPSRAASLQALRLGEAAAARAADDGDEETAAQRGVPVDELGDGAEQDVGRLQGLYAAGEQGYDGVLRQPEAGAGGGAAVAGGEAVEVDAGVDDGDLAGVGLVVADELVGLFGGVRDEAVGGGDDLGLADDAGGGLGRVALGQCGVLDLGHGVHGVDEGDAPAFGGEPAHVPRQPVVGVDEVVVAGAVAGPGPHDPVGEGAQLGRQLLLGEALVRTRVHVAHEDPGASSTTGGRPPVVARVKTSTSMPMAARRLASSTM